MYYYYFFRKQIKIKFISVQTVFILINNRNNIGYLDQDGINLLTIETKKVDIH